MEDLSKKIKKLSLKQGAIKILINSIVYRRQNAVCNEVCNGFIGQIGDRIGIRIFLKRSEKLPIKLGFGAFLCIKSQSN